MLFEALHIASTAAAPFAGCMPSVSSFAEAALLKFGDVLLFLGKYMFAIGSYESCVLAHQLRTSRDHHDLNRRLAGICLQHGDEARALSFYQKVLARARDGLNSDEIYFLSEKTADLCVYAQIATELWSYFGAGIWNRGSSLSQRNK